MASRTGNQDEAKIPCTTIPQLLDEVDRLALALAPEEKEDTWQKFEKALIRFAAITRGGGYKLTETYVKSVGSAGLGDKIVACMLSDRGKLSGVATDFLTAMAPRLGMNFAPLITLYVPPVVRLLARPNKVYLRRAEKCLTTIINHCPVPSMIPLIRVGVTDKSESMRRATGAGLEKIMSEWERPTIGGKGIGELELALRKMATEKDAEVRKAGKRMWLVYVDKWPERVDEFTAPLTPTIRKYLDINADRQRAQPTMARTAAVRLATAHAAPPSAPSHNPLPSSASSSSVLTAHVRPAMASRPPSRTQSQDEPASNHHADPFAPVHAGTSLSRSASAAALAPSHSLNRPGQMRSVSSTATMGQSAAGPSMPSQGPSRPRPRVISASSDLGAMPARRPMAGGSGPVRPNRVVSSSAAGKEMITPVTSSLGAPVRPARDPMASSQTGRAAVTVKREAKPLSQPVRPLASPSESTQSVQSVLSLPATPVEEEHKEEFVAEVREEEEGSPVQGPTTEEHPMDPAPPAPVAATADTPALQKAPAPAPRATAAAAAKATASADPNQVRKREPFKPASMLGKGPAPETKGKPRVVSNMAPPPRPTSRQPLTSSTSSKPTLSSSTSTRPTLSSSTSSRPPLTASTSSAPSNRPTWNGGSRTAKATVAKPPSPRQPRVKLKAALPPLSKPRTGATAAKSSAPAAVPPVSAPLVVLRSSEVTSVPSPVKIAAETPLRDSPVGRPMDQEKWEASMMAGSPRVDTSEETLEPSGSPTLKFMPVGEQDNIFAARLSLTDTPSPVRPTPLLDVDPAPASEPVAPVELQGESQIVTMPDVPPGLDAAAASGLAAAPSPATSHAPSSASTLPRSERAYDGGLSSEGEAESEVEDTDSMAGVSFRKEKRSEIAGKQEKAADIIKPVGPRESVYLMEFSDKDSGNSSTRSIGLKVADNNTPSVKERANMLVEKATGSPSKGINGVKAGLPGVPSTVAERRARLINATTFKPQASPAAHRFRTKSAEEARLVSDSPLKHKLAGMYRGESAPGSPSARDLRR